MSSPPAPALKEIFNAAQFHAVAEEMAEIDPAFDRQGFLDRALVDLEGLSLMQRLRRMTESFHAVLPADYRKSLGLLHQLVPRIRRSFVTMVLPDFVSLYGQSDFGASMASLKFFTPFGSSEFGVREFLKRDLRRTMAVMETWSRDADPAVRRLASEGCRPRLPWSFQLEELIADPSPALALRSLSGKSQRLVVDYQIHYVKKSGASSPKVFKWREVTLEPGAVVALRRTQMIRDFTTRAHHAGRHEVEILINGKAFHGGSFDLTC